MNNEINNIQERNMFHILKQDLKQLTICVPVTAMTSHIQSFVLFYYHYQYTGNIFFKIFLLRKCSLVLHEVCNMFLTLSTSMTPYDGWPLTLDDVI